MRLMTPANTSVAWASCQPFPNLPSGSTCTDTTVTHNAPVRVQVLCIQGFLAARKHADRIILLAEMMQGSGSPCFKAGGAKTVAALRKRFHMGHTEAQVLTPSCCARLHGSRLTLWQCC